LRIHRPVVLTIAGSDSGGGAGIQADLKTIAAHGCFGTSAITAVTAQNTVGVRAIQVIDPSVLAAQIAAVAEDMTIAAIKIGMVATPAHAAVIGDALRQIAAPAVLDPVLVATSGDSLGSGDLPAALTDLSALCALATPNHREAAALGELGCPTLLTGGDEDGDMVVDSLNGPTPAVFRAPRVLGGPFHGTGCTLSSAIASRLALGSGLDEAVAGAILWVQAQLSSAWTPGKGSAVLPHPSTD